ncbi:MAG: hypothetical protein ABI638_01650 [Ignavibacteriota bacterium]
MRLRYNVIIIITAVVIIFSSKTFSQNEGHPLIKGFEGSFITGQEVKEFDEQELVIGESSG